MFAAYQTWTNDVWMLDNNGNPIMAQGGGISKFGNTYYWYGVQYAEMGPYYSNGVVNTSSSTFVAINCYSSQDLVHWTFQNHSVSKSTAGFSNPGWVGRLGQVVYSSANSQYVMWFEGLGGQACCTCSTPTGNFVLNNVQGTITNVYFGPGAGDCTIFCDGDHGGTPYFICSDPHGRQHAYVCPLSSSYTTIGNALAINDTGSIPAWPQGQEANNMFERNGVYYYTMSDLAGWSYSAAYEVNSTSIFSPTSYTSDARYLGTTADFTHYSQVSFGFQVAGAAATNYIMVGDRWAQFINTYGSAGHGQGYAIMCPITFTNGTPYFNSVNMFQVDTVTGKIRPATPADVPTNLVAVASQEQSPGQVQLNWTAMDGATAYNVYRSTISSGPYAAIASPAANNYTDAGLQNGTTYYYVVTSTNIFGESADSIQVSATPSIGPVITAASVSPNPVLPDGALTISATVTAQANPIGAVTVNASALGGAASQALVLDGVGDYTNTITVSPATLQGVQPLTINAVDSLGNAASPYSLSVIVGSENIIWNGGGVNENWSDGANWSSGTGPGPGYSLDFAGQTGLAPFMDASYNVYLLAFDNTAGSFNINTSGNTLTLTGAVTNNSGNLQTLNVPIALGAPVTFDAASADLVFGQNIANSGDLLTITDGGHNTTVAGAISGTGGLSYLGIGTNTLLGANTFSGNIVVSNGVLAIGGSGQLGAGGIYSGTIVDNGTLNYGSASAQTLSGIISGSGAVKQNGSGPLTLAGANTFAGPMTVTAGTLSVANTLALQNSTLSFNGGSVSFNGVTAVTLGGLSGNQNLSLLNQASVAVALTVGNNNATTMYSGVLSGTGSSLTKTGTGMLTLSGANSYSGTTTVNGGTLELPAGGAINGGALGGGGFLIDGGVLTSSGTTSFNPLSNAFLESAGTVNLGNLTEPNNDGLLIKITGGAFAAASLTLQRTAIFTVAPTATAPVAASTTSGLYINGATANASLGTLTIGTGNSSDSVRVDAGALVVTNEVLVGHTSNTRWEILQVNGGGFTSPDTVNGIVLSQNNGSTSNNSEMYLSGGTTTAGRIAFGVATDTVGGSGFLIINGGTLYVGSGGIVRANSTGHYTSAISLLSGAMGAAADWASSLPMQLNSGNFTIQTADASSAVHNIVLSGALTGSGGLTETGTGILTLNGTNTYTGGTTVNGGTLAGMGVISSAVTIDTGGALAPGNPLGTFTISNNLTLAAGSMTLMQVQHSPLTNDSVKVSGTLTEGGTLTVTNFNVIAFAAGDTFKLFNAGTYSGAFSKFILPPLPAGLGWNTSALNVSGALSVVALTSPKISGIKMSGANLTVSGTGGLANWPYYVLTTTNLTSPFWIPFATNQFDASGNFAFTNVINPLWPQLYYRLQLP
ncbi:MAG TPA: autotransporter-associated beta strand repeat-containing protein [Pseudomonadales bacterium]|nr:autotransporter-associated beta strand repeat-containing protein [Pseudomonadales bacterium]